MSVAISGTCRYYRFMIHYKTYLSFKCKLPNTDTYVCNNYYWKYTVCHRFYCATFKNNKCHIDTLQILTHPVTRSPWQVTSYTNNVKKTRGYSLTLTFFRITRGQLIAKRPSIFYEMPTLPPYLVHHSFSQVKSRVHRLLQETQLYATLKANQLPMGVTSCLPERRHAVPIRVTKSSVELNDRANTTSAVP